MPQIANNESGSSVRGKLNAILPQDVSFSTTVPLDGNKVMAAQTISGALAFSAGSSPAIGAQCYVRLAADGTNVPTFAGLTEHGSSAGFLNTAGAINLVRFWHDGVTSYFAIAQALNAVPFVMQSAAIASGTPTYIAVTFDRDMNQTITPATGAFAVTTTNSGAQTDNVTAVAWVDARTLRITKSRTTLSGDTVSVAYTVPGSNPLTDANGNVAGARSGLSVTNGVSGGSVSYLRLPNLTTNMTETADGSGWDYVPSVNDNTYDNNRVAYSTLRLSSGQDGGWYGKLGASVTTAGPGPIVALTTNSTPGSFGDVQYGIYYSSGGGSNYQSLGGSPSTINATACAAGDLVGVFRSGSTIEARVSKDNGSSWTVVFRWSSASTAALTAFYQVGTNGTKGTLIQPAKTGTWA